VRAKGIAVVSALALAAEIAQSQQVEKPLPKGREFVGLPALNFDSD
jgi:hypothetical protein